MSDLKIYSGDLSKREAENSGAMKKILSQGDEVAKILHEKTAQKDFYAALQENKGNIKETLSDLKYNNDDEISADEANQLAKKLIPHGNRFLYRKKPAAAAIGSFHSDLVAEALARPRTPIVQPTSLPKTPQQMFQKNNFKLNSSGLIKRMGL